MLSPLLFLDLNLLKTFDKKGFLSWGYYIGFSACVAELFSLLYPCGSLIAPFTGACASTCALALLSAFSITKEQ